MVEAVDYEVTDKVTIFFGEIFDTVSGETNTAPVMKVFWRCTDINNFIKRRLVSPG